MHPNSENRYEVKKAPHFFYSTQCESVISQDSSNSLRTESEGEEKKEHLRTERNYGEGAEEEDRDEGEERELREEA